MLCCLLCLVCDATNAASSALRLRVLPEFWAHLQVEGPLRRLLQGTLEPIAEDRITAAQGLDILAGEVVTLPAEQAAEGGLSRRQRRKRRREEERTLGGSRFGRRGGADEAADSMSDESDEGAGDARRRRRGSSGLARWEQGGGLHPADLQVMNFSLHLGCFLFSRSGCCSS